MSSYDNLQWRRVAPRSWRRGIDENERAYTTLAKVFESSGRGLWFITGHLSLRIDSQGESLQTAETLVDDAIRSTWIALRYQHPTIASQVTWDPQANQYYKVYETISNEQDKARWLEEALIRVDNGQTGVEWANSDLPPPRIPTLHVICLPREVAEEGRSLIRRDIVFRSPHDVIDGIGTLHLFGNFVTMLSDVYEHPTDFVEPTFGGEETSNLSPPFRIAAQVPDSPTDLQVKRLAEMAAKTQQRSPAAVKRQVLALPYKKGALVPDKYQRVVLRLSKEETSHLLKSCKVKGVTVTQAFHSAIPLAMRDMNERGAEAREMRYVNYLLRNERASCVAPYDTAAHAVTTYHSISGETMVIDVTVPAAGRSDLSLEERRDEYLAGLDHVRDFYQRIRNDPEYYSLTPLIWKKMLRPLPPHSDEPLPVPPPSSEPSVSISSMGVIDKMIPAQIGNIDVYDPWVTGEELMNGFGLFLGTFRGELSLSAAYNEAWHDEREVSDFIKRCKDIVFSGLRVELRVDLA